MQLKSDLSIEKSSDESSVVLGKRRASLLGAVCFTRTGRELSDQLGVFQHKSLSCQYRLDAERWH